MNKKDFTSFATLFRRESERNFRVWQQTFLPPVVSAVLYILIFGRFIGDRIGEMGGVSYVDFLIPGIIMMNVIMGSYGGSAFSVFFSKWEKTIHDILTAPISYIQMVLAILTGAGLIRSLVISSILIGVLGFFGSIQIVHIFITLFYICVVSLFFASFGMMVGLWAERFDHFNIIQTFFITPLIYFGGVFYSIQTLPPTLQIISRFNPLFYMVNGIRYGMTGFTDTNMFLNTAIVTALALIMIFFCVRLFKSGYKMRV